MQRPWGGDELSKCYERHHALPVRLGLQCLQRGLMWEQGLHSYHRATVSSLEWVLTQQGSVLKAEEESRRKKVVCKDTVKTPGTQAGSEPRCPQCPKLGNEVGRPPRLQSEHVSPTPCSCASGRNSCWLDPLGSRSSVGQPGRG